MFESRIAKRVKMVLANRIKEAQKEHDQLEADLVEETKQSKTEADQECAKRYEAADNYMSDTLYDHEIAMVNKIIGKI